MIDYHSEDPQSEKNTSHGSTMSLMRTAVIGQRLEKFFNSQLFPDSLLARADHCTSMKLEEEEKNKQKKGNHCGEHSLLNLSQPSH